MSEKRISQMSKDLEAAIDARMDNVSMISDLNHSTLLNMILCAAKHDRQGLQDALGKMKKSPYPEISKALDNYNNPAGYTQDINHFYELKAYATALALEDVIFRALHLAYLKQKKDSYQMIYGRLIYLLANGLMGNYGALRDAARRIDSL